MACDRKVISAIGGGGGRGYFAILSDPICFHMVVSMSEKLLKAASRPQRGPALYLYTISLWVESHSAIPRNSLRDFQLSSLLDMRHAPEEPVQFSIAKRIFRISRAPLSKKCPKR